MKCDPMKPAPPVTRRFISPSLGIPLEQPAHKTPRDRREQAAEDDAEKCRDESAVKGEPAVAQQEQLDRPGDGKGKPVILHREASRERETDRVKRKADQRRG